MIQETALIIINASLGLLIGILMPGSILYLALIIKKNKFNLQLIRILSLRIILIVIIFIILFILVAIASDLVGLEIEETPDSASVAGGFGFILGFLTGTIALIIGLVRGVKSVLSSRSKE